MAAIHALRDGVLRLSAERVWSEVKRIFMADDPRLALALMAQTGVLALVMPQAEIGRLDALLARAAPVDALLRMSAVFGGDPVAYAERWKLSGAERERLVALKVPNTLTPDADDAALRRALAEEPAWILVDRSWLGQDDTPGWEELRARLGPWSARFFRCRGGMSRGLGLIPDRRSVRF